MRKLAEEASAGLRVPSTDDGSASLKIISQGESGSYLGIGKKKQIVSTQLPGSENRQKIVQINITTCNKHIQLWV